MKGGKEERKREVRRSKRKMKEYEYIEKGEKGDEEGGETVRGEEGEKTSW